MDDKQRIAELEQKLVFAEMDYTIKGLNMGINEADAYWIDDLYELGIEADNRIEGIARIMKIMQGLHNIKDVCRADDYTCNRMRTIEALVDKVIQEVQQADKEA